MNKIRKTYLLTGGFHPVGQIISILHYGRKIAQVEGTRCLIGWSEDGNRLEYNQEFIRMEDFRGYSHRVLQEAHELMSGMMFGWDPVQDLAALKDDLRENTQGYSFVSNPANGLQRCYRQLLQRSWECSPETALQKDGEWRHEACSAYLEEEQKMLRYILLLLHLTGGQPARGPELTTIRHQNSSAAMRNIYVSNGQLFYMIEYHKARRTTNKSFFVVRYLPLQVGQMLFKYLVYVRPFVNLILRHQYGGATLSENNKGALLFSNPQGTGSPWRSEILSQALRDSSSHLEMSFSISNYRQVVIAITKRHIRAISVPFNINDDVSSKADLSNAVWSWQAGHRPLQNSTSYALDRAFPNKLQPELLRLYHHISLEWHSWLGMK